MTQQTINVQLSTRPAEACWGADALLSYGDSGITIHLPEQTPLAAIQRAARRIADQGIRAVRLCGDGWDRAACQAFWQGGYAPRNALQIDWSILPAAERAALEQRIAILRWVRETINLPAEALGPHELAQRALDLLREAADGRLDYQLLSGEALREQGYLGLYTVGKGSARPPVLLSVDVNPSGAAEAPIAACLVGKGITFDSGGYSLKPSQSMDSMKSDMGGAALLTGALALALRQGLTQRVKLILCCADNLVSSTAFKLGDIITYRNGKTVEVMNTDAEGRLVLADGLIDASATQAPLIIDCATLTGAAKVALGNDYHAVLSVDDALVERLMRCADQEREPFWRLPLAPFHRQQLPSRFADLSNIAASSCPAGASTAAAFLSHFVTDWQRGWLHIDCSATYRKSPVAQWAAGATGLGVTTLARLLLQSGEGDDER